MATNTENASETLDGVFDCLADGTRRRLLGVLHERAPESATPRDLATRLADAGKGEDQRGNDTLRQARLALHHVHLPKLDRAGLVDLDADREDVVLADHRAFEDGRVVDAIGAEGAADSDSLDDLFAALADGRRRTVLDALSHQTHPIHAETLGREVLAKERDAAEHEVPEEDVEPFLVELRHLHLPVLADADLVEYDAEAGTVAYEGHPELPVPWMHSVFAPDFRPSLTGESEPQEVGTIEGREGVISFGQSLCEGADEELFCMFTDTDLLEAGCLTRIRDASRRGVDVYLGTRDPTLREYVRENAPEVVRWEPNTDWLNLPVAGDRVGRLLLADREAVMLGTLKEKRQDGFHEERAVVGEGTGNTLVVMIRQLLGPHLERIDEGAEDVEAQLPF